MFISHENNGVVFMTATEIQTRHAFSTRLGGVSEGPFASLNLSFSSGDRAENVLENYRRLGAAVGIDPFRAAFTKQVHGRAVRIVTAEDKCAPDTPSKIECDALVTAERGLPLFCFTADCVPRRCARRRRRGALRLAQLGGRHTRRRGGGDALPRRAAGGHTRRLRPGDRQMLL